MKYINDNDRIELRKSNLIKDFNINNRIYLDNEFETIFGNQHNENMCM